MDLIERQKAIDALDGEIEITGRTNAEAVRGYVRLVRDRLECLPSVQPETHEERTETHACDLISRQEAITAIQEAYADTEGGTDKCAVWKNVGLTNALHIMQDLPPAQPEPLTDKEQRIFLAAMGREEDVCKQVDAECRDCREPYEDSLVSTCHEITRKVKGALWT